MKIKLAVVAAILFTGLLAKGIGAYPGFSMGSTNTVENYSAQQVYVLAIFIYQNTIAGQQYAAIYGSTGTLSFNYKADLDAFFQQKFQEQLNKTATNRTGSLDPFLPYSFYALASGYNEVNHKNINYFGVDGTFYMVQQGGSFYPPSNLSQTKLGLLEAIGYKVPSLSWARMEISDVVAGTNVVYDPLVNPSATNWIRVPSKIIFVPTQAAVSGASGRFRTKINLVSGAANDFQVFGSSGNQIPENPFWLGNPQASTSPPSLNFRIYDGEIGRVLRIFSSASPGGPWTNAVSTATITPYSSGGISISASAQMPNQWFRACSTNAIPVY